MKNLKYIIIFVLILITNAFSQEIKEHKEDLYILFSNNEKNTYFKNDSIVVRTFNLYYSKFNDAKSIELKIDKNNNLEKINWIRGTTSTLPIVNFYYLSDNITHNERNKIDIRNIKNLLEEDEIIKYIEFNNLKEILNKFNIYAVQKDGEEYFAYKVEYSIL